MACRAVGDWIDTREIVGNRYTQWIGGYGDISRVGGVARFTLNAPEEGARANSKFPSHAELIQWIYDNMGVGGTTAIVKKVRRAWIAAPCFALRGSELSRLWHNDVTLRGGESGKLFTITIASAKLIHAELGRACLCMVRIRPCAMWVTWGNGFRYVSGPHVVKV